MIGKIHEALSDSLTPNDIKNKEFKRTVWGYAPQAVVDFLDATAKSWEKVQRHEKEMIEEINAQRAEIERWKNRETELDELRENARLEAEALIKETKVEADALFAQAKRKAEEVREQTEEWLASVIAEVEEMERRRENFIQEFRASLDRHYTLFDDQKGPIHMPLETNLDRYVKAEESPTDRPI
jgi:cell division initiation protein